MVDWDVVIWVSVLVALAVLIAILLYPILRAAVQGTRNRRLPIVSMPARVVVKRTWTGGFLFHIVSTDYYVTFQLDSGERREFRVTGHAYGTLVEGDAGSLSVQGTRYLGFERGR
jgi:hypothetical protein